MPILLPVKNRRKKNYCIIAPLKIFTVLTMADFGNICEWCQIAVASAIFDR